MLTIGKGTLSLGCGNCMDGVNFFKVLSPSLLYRVMKPKKRRYLISGWWLAIGSVIVWFKKENYIYGIGEVNHV